MTFNSTCATITNLQEVQVIDSAVVHALKAAAKSLVDAANALTNAGDSFSLVAQLLFQDHT